MGVVLNSSNIMEPLRISMLPIEQWQEAVIIKFRYTYLAQSCNATIVYYLPIEVLPESHDRKMIHERIENALRNIFGEIYVWKRDVAFDNIKGELKQVYDGGRPKVSLVLRMIPEIPVDDYQKYYGKEIYAYDYHLNIHLDYLGQLDQYTKDLLITGPFQFEQEQNIEWGANNIETL